MKILCAGMMSTDIIAAPVDYANLSEDTVRVERIEVRSGGDCMNVAVGLARLGADVSFCGKVGSDLFGSFLRDRLIESGVDISGLVTDETAPTAACITLINDQAQRMFLYCGGTNKTFAHTDVSPALLSSCDHLHISGVMQLPGLDGSGCANLLRRAKEAGKTTSLDVTWDSTGRWLELMEESLPYLDFFLPSELEARHITSKSDPREMAAFLREKGVGAVVIKLGEKGSYVSWQAGECFQKAFKVPVLDTTGAGDAFVAGFLYGYAAGKPLPECLEIAAAVGAHCVMAYGATTGVPDAKTLTQFLEFHRRDTSAAPSGSADK